MKCAMLGMTWLLVLGAFVGCDEAALYVSKDPNNSYSSGGIGGSTSAMSQPQGTSLSLADCMPYDSPHLSRICAYDAKSVKCPQDGTAVVLPNVAPFGVAFQFTPDYVPVASDITVNGPGSAVQVFTAPYLTENAINGGDGLEVPARAALTAGGALIVTVLGRIPNGNLVSVDLSFGALFRSRLHPPDGTACNLPDPWYCGDGSAMGYRGRFKVEGVPSGQVSNDAPAGNCLLLYNSALVAEDADPCCYRKGEANSCDIGAKCNALSGANCCLIYGSGCTNYGQRCCLYESGELGDGASECDSLLAK